MNMVSVAEEKQQKDLNFTSQATAEVKVMCSAVRDVLDIAMEAFEKHDLELATRVEPLEEVVDKIRTKLKNRHVKRLQTGECTIEMGFVFSDLLTNLERVSDHCSNIAVLYRKMTKDLTSTSMFRCLKIQARALTDRSSAIARNTLCLLKSFNEKG